MVVKIRAASVILIVMLTAACAAKTEKLVSDSPPKKSEKSNTTAKAEHASFNSKGSFNILVNIPYAENGNIPENVAKECQQLGKQFSNSIVKYAPKHGISVEKSGSALPTKGKSVELEIVDVYSSGNAFIGHRKSATVSAKLMMDGKEVSRTTKTRNSGGGFLGGFKSSCAVLAHTVNTLGSDVGKWLSQQ